MAPYAFGAGRGEQLTPLKPFKNLNIVLICPEIAIPTAWAYDNLNLKLTKKENNISILRNFLPLSNVSRLCSMLQNDLEPVVFRSYPEILSVRNRLRDSGAEGVLMSGSGSAVFGIFTDPEQADNAYYLLNQELVNVFLAPTIQTFSEFLPKDILDYP